MPVVVFTRVSDGRLRRRGVAPGTQKAPAYIEPAQHPLVERALTTGTPVVLDVDASSEYDASRVLFVPWSDETHSSGACVVIAPEASTREPVDLEHLGTVIPARIGTVLKLRRLEVKVAQLEQAAEAFRSLVQTTSDPVHVVDLDGRVRTWNAACEALYGFSEKEVVGEVLPHVPPAERSRWIAEMRDAVALGSIQDRDVVGARKDGSRFGANIVAIPLRDEDGMPAGVLTVVRRIDSDSRLEQMQNDFLALITQELKNPLTAILGLAQMLSRPEFRDDPAKRARTVRALEARAADMSVTVDDLLLASRIERSGLALVLAAVDVGGLVTETVGRFERSGHDHRIAVDVDTRTIAARADGRRLAQAVTCLLANAVKHSPPGGEILVTVARDSRVGSIAVSDRGEGIPPEDLERVFDRFYKVASGKRDPGTGLGLFLVRSIAEAHGGSVSVVSKHGKGSTFTMRIPLAE